MDITLKNVRPEEDAFINCLLHLEFAREFMNSEDCTRATEQKIEDEMQIFSVNIRRLIK